jgi:hypothetical protein
MQPAGKESPGREPGGGEPAGGEPAEREPKVLGTSGQGIKELEPAFRKLMVRQPASVYRGNLLVGWFTEQHALDNKSFKKNSVQRSLLRLRDCMRDLYVFLRADIHYRLR